MTRFDVLSPNDRGPVRRAGIERLPVLPGLALPARARMGRGRSVPAARPVQTDRPAPADHGLPAPADRLAPVVRAGREQRCRVRRRRLA